jgi:hypothetical protein
MMGVVIDTLGYTIVLDKKSKSYSVINLVINLGIIPKLIGNAFITGVIKVR